MELFTTFLIIVGAFIIWIGATALVKGCSINEATIKCKKICGEIFQALIEPTPPPQTIYPVCIGWDGNRIVPEFVEDEFLKIRQNFAVCCYTNVNFSRDGSLIIYNFDITPKENSRDAESLQRLIQKLAEETLVHTMRHYDCYIPAEPLTHVEVYPNKLRIFLARNSAGIITLDKRKKMVRRRKIEAAQTSHTNLTENWNDEGQQQ